jgi:hypothetical protein
MPTSFDRIATSLQPYWRQDSSMGPDPRAASQRRGKTPARCRPCCGVAGVMERSGLTLGVLRRGSPLVRFERHRALSRTSLVGRDKPCGWRVRGASAGHLERVRTLVLRQQPAHRRDLPHLDGVSIQSGQDAVEPRHIAAIDQRRPPVEIAHMRLAGDAAQRETTANRSTPQAPNRSAGVSAAACGPPKRSTYGGSWLPTAG